MARLMGSSLKYGIVLLLMLFSRVALAQNGVITGKVVAADSKQSLSKASVFLSNATFGTTTADDGSFTLRNIKPGQYQLVVSNVGYDEYTQTIMVGNDVVRLSIELKPKVTQLREVVVMTDADWKKNYELFKNDFIGTSENSKKCKVLNPRTVNLSYNGSKRLLEAYTDEFLVVENQALGYRVKYLVKDFKSDKISGIVSYEGRALFEDLPGSASQKAKWRAKRDEVYYGSARHFYRALYNNRLAADGFVVMLFTRELNPARPPEDVILKKLKQFKTNRDSLIHWQELNNMPKYYHERLQREPLKQQQLLYNTGKPGIFALTSNRYLLYVVYTKKREEQDFKDLYRPLDMENFETSVITFYNPFVYFDMNGTVIADAPLYEGTWSKSKLAEMLPVDYEPGD